MKKLITILSISSLILTGCYTTEKGEKTGSIVKFAKEGFIIKTFEGELIRGNLNSGSGSFGRSFYFTVENLNLIKVIEKSMKEGKEVKIKYHKEWITFLRTENKNYFVDEIEILN